MYLMHFMVNQDLLPLFFDAIMDKDSKCPRVSMVDDPALGLEMNGGWGWHSKVRIHV